MIKKRLFCCFVLATLVISCASASFYSTKLNSFTAKLDSSGTIKQYEVNLNYLEDTSASRAVLLYFVPEQYTSELNSTTRFSDGNLGNNYHLKGDTNPYSGSAEYDPSTHEGVLSENYYVSGNNTGAKTFTFSKLKLFSDSTKGLDTSKSYSVYFILRTVHDGTKIFRNAQQDRGILGTVLPVKIKLMKFNPTTRQYEETDVYTHLVEGSTISYETWPAKEIAGEGYVINTAKSSGAGKVVAQSGVGSVDNSNRRAQDLTIYYDYCKVTLNPKGGTIETDVIYVAANQALPERDDLIPQKTCGRFLGWTTDSNATTVTVTSNTNITGDVTYYAVWENQHIFEYTAEDTALFAKCTKQGCQYHDNPLKLFFKPQWSASLEAKLQPATASCKYLVWTSSDTGVLTVDQGHINGVAPGTATVTATAMDGSNVSTTCTVTLQN